MEFFSELLQHLGSQQPLSEQPVRQALSLSGGRQYRHISNVRITGGRSSPHVILPLLGSLEGVLVGGVGADAALRVSQESDENEK